VKKGIEEICLDGRRTGGATRKKTSFKGPGNLTSKEKKLQASIVGKGDI